MIRKYPLTSYFIFATLFTSVLLLPLILFSQGLSTWAVSQDWHWVGALGPIMAACIVVASLYGSSGLTNYLTSLFDTRFSLLLFFVAILPLLLFLIVQPLLLLLEREQVNILGELSFGWWLSTLISSLAYGIGEEAGWRGFALPRLQARFTALTAVIILTVFHALWHLPFFFYRLEFGLVGTVGFFIGMLAGAICISFLYNQSGGKTLLPILWHTTWNVVSLLTFATIPETAYIISTLFIVIAVVIIVVFKPKNLARKELYAIRDSHSLTAPKTLIGTKG